MTKTQVIKDMPEGDYHSLPQMSKSALAKFAESPKLYEYIYILGNTIPRTPDMILGSAVHKMALEGGDVFNNDYTVAPQVDRRTKVGKSEWSAFLEKSKDKVVLTSDQFDDVLGMVSSMQVHPVVGPLLERVNQVETSLLYELDGVPMRSRLDGITDDTTIIDIKTCRSAGYWGFRKTIIDFKYNWQAFIYSHGYAKCLGVFPKDFLFLAVEKTPPYECSVVRITDKSMEEAAAEVKDTLDFFKECKVKDEWPSAYAEGVIEIDV